MELKGKKAIITGGGRGLGKATVLALAKEGVHIGISGRNEETLKQTIDELKTLGVEAYYSAFDVSNKDEVYSGIENLVKSLGGVDILVNNAGIAEFGSVKEMQEETWESIIQTNLMGVYYVTKATLPHLNSESDIVNIASTAGLKGGANISAYSASKAAVIAFSESLMAELRKSGIRVFTLTPSTIATDLTMSEGLNITDGNPEKVLQPTDFAEWIVDMLKMNRRALIANASIFSTNP